MYDSYIMRRGIESAISVDMIRRRNIIDDGTGNDCECQYDRGASEDEMLKDLIEGM